MTAPVTAELPRSTGGTLPAGEYQLGPVSAIPLGEGRAYAVGAAQVAVFRLRDGSLRGLSAVCPHAGGPLADGQLDASVVMCPLHARTFDLLTGNCRNDDLAVPAYPVREQAGEVILAVPGDPS
jgi:nitrite reductase (NADH) small subunit